jgi:hypothetical protein
LLVKASKRTSLTLLGLEEVLSLQQSGNRATTRVVPRPAHDHHCSKRAAKAIRKTSPSVTPPN